MKTVLPPRVNARKYPLSYNGPEIAPIENWKKSCMDPIHDIVDEDCSGNRWYL